MSYETPFPFVNLKSDKEVNIRNYKTEDVGSLTLKKQRFTVYFCALDADTYEVVKNPPPSNLRTQMKQQHIIHLHFMF